LSKKSKNGKQTIVRNKRNAFFEFISLTGVIFSSVIDRSRRDNR
jgi:hypothetical protein